MIQQALMEQYIRWLSTSNFSNSYPNSSILRTCKVNASNPQVHAISLNCYSARKDETVLFLSVFQHLYNTPNLEPHGHDWNWLIKSSITSALPFPLLGEILLESDSAYRHPPSSLTHLLRDSLRPAPVCCTSCLSLQQPLVADSPPQAE